MSDTVGVLKSARWCPTVRGLRIRSCELTRANTADAGRLCSPFSTASSPPCLAVRFGHSKGTEIIVLRQQLSDLHRQIDRPRINDNGRTPVRSLAADTYAERWIGFIHRELPDLTIIWNQPQLERLDLARRRVLGRLRLAPSEFHPDLSSRSTA